MFNTITTRIQSYKLHLNIMIVDRALSKNVKPSKKKGFNSRNNLFSFPNNSKKEGKEIN